MEKTARRRSLLRNLEWCGTRRTVVGREAPIFAILEFDGLLDVPHKVSINKSASFGFLWNRIGNIWDQLSDAMRKYV